MNRWFRLYGEFVSDPKVQLLAFEDQRHFIALLCLKCNGVLDSKAPSPEYRDRMIAKALGLSQDAALEARRRLVECGLVDDRWQPCKWSERQFTSDTSAERTRAYRQRKKRDGHSDVTVTPQNRTEQNRTEETTRSRASRLPADFSLTPERRQTCEAEGLNAERTLAKFCDYWTGVPGAKGRKLDWDATWRNWCRSERDRAGPARTTERRFVV